MNGACRAVFILLLAAAPALRAAGAGLTPRGRPTIFDRPPGPQFSEAAKQAQRERGAGVVPRVRRAFEAGEDSVVIPPGDYRFGKEGWGRDGPVYPLEFRGMKRDAAHPFRIVAEGVTFWFDLPPDQTPRAHFALGFVDCSHLSLEGATLDRDPRGCMEGRITAIDDAGNRIEIEASAGTFVPAAFSGDLNQRLVPFNADGTFCAALYALQLRGPARLQYRNVEPGTWPGRHWVNLHASSELLTVNRDPAWHRAYGDAGTLQGCTFTRIGSSVQLHSNFFTKNEGGICRSISILSNVFHEVAVHPEGVAIDAGFQSLNHDARTPVLSNLTIRGNTFVRPGRHAISLALVRGGEISGNVILDSGHPRAIAGWPPPREGVQPVQLRRCAGITVSGNRLGQGGAPPAAAATGDALVNARESSEVIVTP